MNHKYCSFVVEVTRSLLSEEVFYVPMCPAFSPDHSTKTAIFILI